MFNVKHVRALATRRITPAAGEEKLIESFVEVCRFLHENPSRLSWRGKLTPSVTDDDGILRLLTKYFEAYRRRDYPLASRTVPDPMIDEVMRIVWSYRLEQMATIAQHHRNAMSAENVIGALLERYLDSVLRQHGWHWCCGSLVRAVDFLYRKTDGSWIAMQIKNRDNSENSSSSAIRSGTQIQKWFRSYSCTGDTNWENLPSSMQGFGLSERGFLAFVKRYLAQSK